MIYNNLQKIGKTRKRKKRDKNQNQKKIKLKKEQKFLFYWNAVGTVRPACV